MAKEGLGNGFDVVAVADGVYLNLKDVGGVTFVGLLAGGDDFTVTEATSAAGAGAQNLAVFDKTYSQTDGDGTDTWTENDEGGLVAVANAHTTDAACAIYVDAKDLSDGFTHVACTATSTGIVVAILHDLKDQRKPTNLPARAA